MRENTRTTGPRTMRAPDGATTSESARLAVAGRLASAYGGDPAVIGVLCAGSTGRGDADRWSDLEMLVLWESRPTAERRRRAPDASAAKAVRLFDYEPAEFAAADDFWLDGEPGDGLLVEVGHATADDATAALDRLLVDASPDPYLLTVAAAYAYGVPLYGDLAPWRERVETYPSALAAAVISRHGQIDNFWRWRMYVERDNPHGLRAHFAATATALTHIACALSGRFWPGPKWPGRTLAGLPVAPVDIAERLVAVDEMPPSDAAAALTDLVEESYDLVAVRGPDVDVDRLRRIFRFGRAPWPPERGGRAADCDGGIAAA
ncbi:MAG TPA: hypothetical protein VFR11_10170 [Micromonosporaceae bacterium]|nr:hypothetical protein [Micromonosporaceae bacterium]